MRTCLLAAVAVAVLAIVAGCDGGRLPVCKTDADCSKDDAGTGVCYNLKCVQCKNDSNCPAGSYCTDTTNTCSVVDERVPEVDGGTVGWEPPADTKPAKGKPKK